MSHATDFDFLFGSWQVKHRRLKARLTGCDEWEEFGGTTVVQPLLGGAANLDDNVLELPSGTYRAITLRAFEAKTAQWSIWWLDGRHPHQLDVPVKGGFSGNEGVFLANDVLDGRPISIRFRWTPGQTPQWEQAFSPGGGQHWETNWTMEFHRA